MHAAQVTLFENTDISGLQRLSDGRIRANGATAASRPGKCWFA